MGSMSCVVTDRPAQSVQANLGRHTTSEGFRETRGNIALSKQGVDLKKGMYKLKTYDARIKYKEYKAPKPYVPPPYKDPLRQKPREYKKHFEIPEYKPYIPKPIHVEYKEYKGPFIDPLTGKPHKGKEKAQTPTPEEEVQLEAKKPVPRMFVSYNRFVEPQRSKPKSKNLDF